MGAIAYSAAYYDPASPGQARAEQFIIGEPKLLRRRTSRQGVDLLCSDQQV